MLFTPVNNYQPSLAMTQEISLFGVYLSQAFGEPYVGALLTFAGNFALNGYQAANGALLPIAENDALFSLIGTTYGGDGQTIFALPDLVGRVTVGTGSGPGLPTEVLGQTSGTAGVTLTLNQVPVSIGGGGQSFNDMQPSLALTYDIAVQGVFPSRNFDPATAAAGTDPFLGEVEPLINGYVPRGWMECAGQILSIAQNQALFSLLGTTYGGNGQTTFALPDLRGRTIVGANGGSVQLGETGGEATHTLTSAQVPDGLGNAVQTFNNMQPYLGLNYVIGTQEVFPPRGFEPTTAVGGTEPYIGEVFAFVGNFAPRGYAFCDGSLLAIASNTALFSILGTQYGGDGRTTFALPDLRGRTIIGAGFDSGLGDFAVGDRVGEAATTVLGSNLPDVPPFFTSNGGGVNAAITKIDAAVLVTTVLAATPTGDSLTLSITGGEDRTLFQIVNGNQLRFVSAPDLDAPPSVGATAGYQVDVRASDALAGSSATQRITVNLSPNAHVTGVNVSYADAIGAVYVDVPTHLGYRADTGLSYSGGPLSITPIATDTLAGATNIAGSAFDDLLVGDNGANTISGGGGNDVLFGQGGGDVISGGGVSGSGYNQIWGGPGSDTVTYASETAAVTADLTGHYGFVGGVAPTNLRDVFNSVENLIGGAGNDTLRGDAPVNTLDGGAGSDVLMGFDGDDWLIGGGVSSGGYNQLFGGNGIDTASYVAETTAVTASLAGLWAYVGGVASTNLRDVFNSIENLVGGSAVDVLVGDGLANILEGGGGAEQLYGGAGADTFVYTGYADSNVVTGYDTVADFVAGTDKIDLRAFSGMTAANVVIISGPASTKLLIEVTPGTFNGATDLAISLIGVNALTVADILF